MVLRLTVIAVIAFATASPALAQYPAKPIRVIVPYPAGGGADLLGRTLSEPISEKLAQSVVIDNRGGATGMIGAELAAKSPPDGYTAVLGSSAELALNAAVYRKMPYDPERDLAPVTLLATSPIVLTVHPSMPARTPKEFIALAKQRPGVIGYATAGNGSPHHVAGEWMKLLVKIDIIHVPYKGGGPQLIDLMGGHVHSGFLALPVVAPHVKAGKLRALAATSAKRSPAIPNVPTLDESGMPGLDVTQWWGVLVPARTPRDVIAKLHAAVVDAVKTPSVKARMAELGAEPVAGTPEQFGEFIRTEIAKYRKVTKETNISVD